MKRSQPLARSPLPPRTQPIKRTTKLAKVNEQRIAKRRERQRKLYRGYRASTTYQVVDARAGGRCEYHDARTKRRCPARTALQHHHLTYARFGGNELPDDMWVLCEGHHRLVEKMNHPTRRQQRPRTRSA